MWQILQYPLQPCTGCTIENDIIPKLIGGIPIITIMTAFTERTAVIKYIHELKIKKSNRIDVMVKNPSTTGVDVEGAENGMIINGGKPLHGAVISPKLDHRIAIAGGLTEGDTDITGAECINIFYPSFYKDFEKFNIGNLQIINHLY